MDIQRLRNLTTQRLHTDIGFIYQDLEWITGQPSLMTHMLPDALKAVTPWLRQHVTDARFWDDAFDQSHVGSYHLPEPTAADRQVMGELYLRQHNPLDRFAPFKQA